MTSWNVPAWAAEQAAYYAKQDALSVNTKEAKEQDEEFVASMTSTLVQGLWSSIRGTVTIDGEYL